MSDETPADRAERCLAMAAGLRAQAKRTADPGVAAGYLELAAIWLQLAEDARSPAPANDFPEAEREEGRKA